jgi:hypothetical protein
MQGIHIVLACFGSCFALKEAHESSTKQTKQMKKNVVRKKFGVAYQKRSKDASSQAAFHTLRTCKWRVSLLRVKAIR